MKNKTIRRYVVPLVILIFFISLSTAIILAEEKNGKADNSNIEKLRLRDFNLTSPFESLVSTNFSQMPNTYKYLNIVPENLDIGLATISFRVNKSWIQNRDIILSKYTSLWSTLATKYVYSDADYSYYQADVFRLGYYAISARDKAELPLVGNESEQIMQENITKKEAEQIINEENEQIIENEDNHKLIYSAIFIISLLIGCALFGNAFIAYRKEEQAIKELRELYAKHASYMNEVNRKIGKWLSAGINKKAIRKKMIQSKWKPNIVDVLLKGK
jgi:hypothetical protein